MSAPQPRGEAALPPLIPSRSMFKFLFISLTTLLLCQCSSSVHHKGVIPFSLLESPTSKRSAESVSQLGTVAKMNLFCHYSPTQSHSFQQLSRHLQAGDVIAFSMSQSEAWGQLKRAKIQKTSYLLFSYGHLALVVPDQTHPSKLKLLQTAMRQTANIGSDMSYLSDKTWYAYRPPAGSINLSQLSQFTHLVTRSSKPVSYDYTATLGLTNGNIHPAIPCELRKKYTCTTLVVAALHYAGFQLHSARRYGLLDIITPRQVIESWGSLSPIPTTASMSLKHPVSNQHDDR